MIVMCLPKTGVVAVVVIDFVVGGIKGFKQIHDLSCLLDYTMEPRLDYFQLELTNGGLEAKP